MHAGFEPGRRKTAPLECQNARSITSAVPFDVRRRGLEEVQRRIGRGSRGARSARARARQAPPGGDATTTSRTAPARSRGPAFRPSGSFSDGPIRTPPAQLTHRPMPAGCKVRPSPIDPAEHAHAPRVAPAARGMRVREEGDGDGDARAGAGSASGADSVRGSGARARVAPSNGSHAERCAQARPKPARGRPATRVRMAPPAAAFLSPPDAREARTRGRAWTGIDNPLRAQAMLKRQGSGRSPALHRARGSMRRELRQHRRGGERARACVERDRGARRTAKGQHRDRRAGAAGTARGRVEPTPDMARRASDSTSPCGPDAACRTRALADRRSANMDPRRRRSQTYRAVGSGVGEHARLPRRREPRRRPRGKRRGGGDHTERGTGNAPRIRAAAGRQRAERGGARTQEGGAARQSGEGAQAATRMPRVPPAPHDGPAPDRDRARARAEPRGAGARPSHLVRAGARSTRDQLPRGDSISQRRRTT